MNQSIFINEAINFGINNYLNKVNNEDFNTIIIKTLINIYGELDIVNPYKTDNKGSFEENITKFGYSKEELDKFLENVLKFYNTKTKQPNKYFNEIEKSLIDMFFLKVKNIDKEKVNFDEFKKLLQGENTNLNKLYSVDKNEIIKYFSFKYKYYNSDIKYNIISGNKLYKEAYEIVVY